jgi:anthranilate synthase component II
MLLLLDNYDSFTFNVARYFRELGAAVRVVRNDALSLEQIEALAPDRLCISPGPGRPSGAGLTLPLIARFAGRVPILGVCLGHQAVAEHFGGRIVHAPTLVHGKASAVHHDGAGLLRGLPSPFSAGRYHSLCVEEASLPGELEVTACTADGVVMALRHRDLPIEGVQFHPESILSEHGHRMLANWLDQAGVPGR